MSDTADRFVDMYDEKSTFNHNVPLCPYCKKEWREDDWYPGDWDELETNCPRCNKEVRLVATVSVNIHAMALIED